MIWYDFGGVSFKTRSDFWGVLEGQLLEFLTISGEVGREGCVILEKGRVVGK